MEIRNSPRSSGPDAGRGRDTIRVDLGCLNLNFEFLIGDVIAHAKSAKDGKGGILEIRNSKCGN